ncbi:Ig-like domain-containing protein, partial [bacterium]|nr:Ig-like domain-containing protein [bacterium]
MKIKFFALGIITLFFLMACDTRLPTVAEKDVVNYQLTVSSDRDVIYADNGNTVAQITALLADAEGIPIQGANISFSPQQGKMVATVSTDQTGRATSNFDDDGQSAESVRIVAQYTDGASNVTRDTLFIQVLPMEALVDTFFLDTQPVDGIVEVTSIDESATVEIFSHVFDANGVPVENVLVNYRILSDENGAGYINSAMDSTNAIGISSTEFRTNTGRLGEVVIEASISSESVATLLRNNPGVYTFNHLGKSADGAAAFSATVTVQAVASSPYVLSVQTQDNLIYADYGVTTARINAFLHDSDGNSLPSHTIYFLSDIGTISSSAYTNDAGTAQVIYSDLGTPITQDSVATIFARAEHPFFGFIEDSVMVSIRLVDPTDNINFNTITNPINGQTIVSDVDSSYVSEVIAYVRNDYGVAMEGVDVTFRILSGLELGYISQSVVVSDSAGSSHASFILNPGVIGSVSIEASIESASVTMADTVGLSFSPIPRYTLAIAVLDELIYADQGETTARVYGVVRDFEGNPISGESVHFSSNMGTISSPGTTDDSGVAESIFSDLGTAFESDATAIVYARVIDPYYGNILDSTEVEIRLPDDQSSTNFFVITDPPGGQILVTDFDSTYTASILAQVRDSRGVALEGVTVDFQVTAGSALGYLSAGNNVSDSSGTATVIFTLNPGMTGTVSIAAFLAGDDSVVPISSDIEFLPMSDYEINAFSYQSIIYYDNGLTNAQVYAVVRDLDGNSIDSVRVNFSSDIGTVTSPDYTNNAGVAEAIFSDLGAVGPDAAVATITARVEHPFWGLRSSTVQVSIQENENE